MFTGINFPTAGAVATAAFNGIEADVITIDSATQVTAHWNLGVPFSGTTAISPVLRFTDNSLQITTVAIAQSTSTLTNSYAATGSTVGLACSFAGGCKLGVTATGLASNLKANRNTNYISVCGKKCEYSDLDSTYTEAKCILPSVSTTYSVGTKLIDKPAVIKPVKISGTGTGAKHSLAFDGLVYSRNIDTITSGQCNIQMEFDPGFTATLDSMKYFLDESEDKQVIYANNLQF